MKSSAPLVLIDAPVGAWSTPLEIRAWIQRLEQIRRRHEGHLPTAELIAYELRKALEWLRESELRVQKVAVSCANASLSERSLALLAAAVMAYASDAESSVNRLGVALEAVCRAAQLDGIPPECILIALKAAWPTPRRFSDDPLVSEDRRYRAASGEMLRVYFKYPEAQ